MIGFAAAAAFALYLAALFTLFGLRTLQHRRETGSTGFHVISRARGKAARLAGIGFAVALLLGLVAPLLIGVLGINPAATLPWLSLLGVIVLIGACQVQMPKVEEPYLIRHHAATYIDYGRRTGRFMPGVGRLTAPPATAQLAPQGATQ